MTRVEGRLLVLAVEWLVKYIGWEVEHSCGGGRKAIVHATYDGYREFIKNPLGIGTTYMPQSSARHGSSSPRK